jgi:hypothetical protein
MTFATTRSSEEQDRIAVSHEVQLGQVVDDLGVDGGLEVEVELLKRLSGH